MVSRASWVWVHEHAPPDAEATAAFLAEQRVGTAWVSVPGAGPSEATRRTVAALTARGIAVDALGGDPGWADDDGAAAWAERAAASGLFAAIHLDIEPWSRPDWHERADALLAGTASAVRAVRAATGLAVSLDLTPWLAHRHPVGFAACAGAADEVVLMAYRDRAPGILERSAAARAHLAAHGVPHRIGVETAPVDGDAPGPGETFADDGRAVLERELAAVAAAADHPAFAGVAVHDAATWARMRA